MHGECDPEWVQSFLDSSSDFVIVSYELAWRMFDRLRQRQFKLMICDEWRLCLKSGDSKRSKTVRELCDLAQHVVLFLRHSCAQSSYGAVLAAEHRGAWTLPQSIRFRRAISRCEAASLRHGIQEGRQQSERAARAAEEALHDPKNLKKDVLQELPDKYREEFKLNCKVDESDIPLHSN